MELQKFVTEALLAIQQAVGDAINGSTGVGAVNPAFQEERVDWKDYVQNVEFELSVTGGEKSSVEGSGEGKLVVITVGGKGSRLWERNVENKIKFSVPVLLPMKTTKRYDP